MSLLSVGWLVLYKRISQDMCNFVIFDISLKFLNEKREKLNKRFGYNK